MLASPSELTYFIALAKTLNFSRAAELIGISQPSLSLAIQRLEQKLEIQLFNRTKYQVHLTPGGQALLTHANKLINYWEMTKYEVTAAEHGINGVITLGCPDSITAYLLMKFLPNLIAANPNLKLELEHGNSQRILDKVVDFSLQLGIVVNPPPHPDLIINKLYQDKTTFWRSVQHQHLNLQSQHSAIICNPQVRQTQWLLKYLHKNNISYARLITTDNYELIANMVIDGCGIGIAPKTIMLSKGANKVEEIPNLASYKDHICLIHRQEFHSLKLVQKLIAIISAQLEQT